MNLLILSQSPIIPVLVETIERCGHRVICTIFSDNHTGDEQSYEALTTYIRATQTLPHRADGIILLTAIPPEDLALFDAFRAPAIIDPSAVISPSSQIGRGCIIMPKVVINADSTLDEDVILHPHSIVEHDCTLGKGVHLHQNATLCGGVNIGQYTHVGAGSIVIPCIDIGQQVHIEPDAVVIRPIRSNSHIAGAPARPI